jgi:cation transport regulator ChaB
MTIQITEELPQTVRGRLPAEVETLFREAFNEGLMLHLHHPARTELAYDMAWKTVKRSCRRIAHNWVVGRD